MTAPEEPQTFYEVWDLYGLYCRFTNKREALKMARQWDTDEPCYAPYRVYRVTFEKVES